MAELLVNVQTGEVVYVAEDGHQWGRRESREVYDAEVARLGRAPRAKVQDVEHVDEVIRDGKGQALRDEAGKERVIRRARPIPGTARGVDIPPPSRLGVIRVPGPAEDYRYLLEDETDEDDVPRGRKTRLDMTGDIDASAVLSRTVAVTRTALEARERRSEAVRGD